MYSYSAYSADLQTLLGYSGTEVNIVSSIGDLGLYVGGIPVGYFFDSFGPSLTYILASVFLFLGYVLMWTGALQKIPSNSWAMGFYFFVVGFGSVAGYMAGLLTNAKNFAPENRGKIVAFLVAAYGLSAAIFSQVYQNAFDHNVARFFWFSALILGSLPVIAIFLVKSVPLVIESKTINSVPSGQSLVAHPLSPPTSKPVPASYSPGKYGDTRGLPVLKSPDFLLLFVVVACCTGVGLTWINIVGSVVRSYEITAIPASGYVIGLSIANAAGRLLFGALCDLKLVSLPPVYLLMPCLAILLLSHFILIFVDNYIYLLVATLLTGISYGGSFAVMPVIINSYFGDKNYGANLGLLILSVALGSMTMSSVSGVIYDIIARSQQTIPPSILHQAVGLLEFGRRLTAGGGSSLVCYGLECFRWTYVMTAAVSALGLLVNILLLRREVKFDALLKRSQDFEVHSGSNLET